MRTRSFAAGLAALCAQLAAALAGEPCDITTIFPMTERLAGALASPRDIVLSDLDGDGDLDAVVAGSQTSFSLMIILNPGDGRYEDVEFLPVGYQLFRIAVADMNGDGSPDILHSAEGFTAVAIRFNAGDGTFRDPVTFEGVGGAGLVRDFDGDGDLDVASTSVFYGTSVVFNDGTGVLQDPTFVDTLATPQSMVALDLEGDGDLDLAYAAGSSSVGFHRNDGSGTFSEVEEFSDFESNRVLSAGDFNGDGATDLFANGDVGAEDLFQFWPNDGTGIFGPPITVAAGFATRITVMDVDADGDLDAIADGGAGFRVLLNDGTGTSFTDLGGVISSTPERIDAGDIDGDGDIDLVGVDRQSWDLVIIRGREDGTFRSPGRAILLPFTPTRAITSVDLDRDGAIDLVLSTFTGAHVMLGDGHGGFTVGAAVPIAPPIERVLPADVDGDGDADLIALANSDGRLFTCLNAGDGTLGPALSTELGEVLLGLASADLDGDGFADVVTNDFVGRTIFVLFGNENGTYDEPLQFDVEDQRKNVRITDWDESGTLDIVTQTSDGRFAVRLNAGERVFEPEVTTPVGAGDDDFVFADLNGDGDLDIVAVLDGQFAVLRSFGGGVFSLPLGQDATAPRAPVSVVDLNNDGDPDLVGGSLAVVPGIASDAFGERVEFAGLPSYTGLAVADFDGNGVPDVITTNNTTGFLTIYLNNCRPCPADLDQDGMVGFTDLLSLLARWGPAIPSTADLDGDGIVGMDDLCLLLAAWGRC